MMEEDLPGFAAPVHRALAEPILLAGAPRALAIVNGTLAAAVGIGLQLWVAGLVMAVIGHGLCVFAARRDAQILPVARRHVALPTLFES
jgi:type IV secretion system protein VirB3